MTKQLSISIGQASDKGIKERNEDFFGALIPNDESLETKGIVCAIADGMGSCEFCCRSQ